MIAIEGSYVGNFLDSPGAIDFFTRGLINVPFKVGKLSELTQVFQLLEEGKIAGRYVPDTSVSSTNHILGLFSDLTSLFMYLPNFFFWGVSKEPTSA